MFFTLVNHDVNKVYLFSLMDVSHNNHDTTTADNEVHNLCM